MPKNVIMWTAVVIIIILALGGWWFFNKTKSVTSHPISAIANAQSSEKIITSFTFSKVNLNGNETIDNNNHTVTLFVPYGTNVTNLTPIISVADSATISPASGVIQNFANPVIYTVTAQDGSTQKYIVTVSVLTNPATNAGS